MDTFRFLTPGWISPLAPITALVYFYSTDVSSHRHYIALAREMRAPDKVGQAGNDSPGANGRCEF